VYKEKIIMEKLKELWSRFKVQISFVAGCLVVATSLGTCTFDPAQTSSDSEEAEAAPAEPAVEVAPQTEAQPATTSTTETTTLEESTETEEVSE
tara:strand:- start:191 stop:472 length:282 start_codon:yes stop_codon:yes gene_type:complete